MSEWDAVALGSKRMANVFCRRCQSLLTKMEQRDGKGVMPCGKCGQENELVIRARHANTHAHNTTWFVRM